MTVDVRLLDAAAHSALYLGEFVRDGALVVIARSSRRPYALHWDVLSAMGCRTDVKGATARRGEARELDLIAAWTTAHGFRDVYICHADYVTQPAWFGPLADAFARGGASTHLVSDNTTRAKLCDWAEQQGHPIVTTVDPLPDPPSYPVPSDVDGDFPQMLPEADFYLWLARCRDLLAPADFQRVLRLYRTVFDTWLNNPPKSGVEASRRLVAIVQHHPTQGEVTTCVRAAQAACFRHGLLLRLKLSHLLATVQDGEARTLTPAEIRALHAYQEPWIGCAVVLRDADHDYRVTESLRLDGVDEQGHVVSHHPKGNPLSPDARLYMRAQRALRLREGAEGSDQFITQPVRKVAEAVRWSRMDLNLPGVTRAHNAKEAHWTERMRLSLHDIPTGGIR